MKKLSLILTTVTISSLLISSCSAINSLKSQAASVIAPSTSSWVMETYAVDNGGAHWSENLYTIQSWSGTNDVVLSFSSNETPMVINYGYTPTSNIASSLQVAYQGGNNGWPVGSVLWSGIDLSGQIIEGTGEYKIQVTASGCNWWIKIGVEQSNVSTNLPTSSFVVSTTPTVKQPYGTYSKSNSTLIFNGNTMQMIIVSGITTTITYTFKSIGTSPTGDYLFSTIMTSYVPPENAITTGTAGPNIDYDASNDKVFFGDLPWFSK